MKNELNPLHKNTLATLNLDSFKPMQLAAIEEGSTGDNLILLSPTGSGKTLGFLSIILEKLSLSQSLSTTSVLVLVPSRELALQVEAVFRSLKSSLKITCCYGGHSFKLEEQSLSEAPAVLIGTPGRILDHISRGTVNLYSLSIVVLDEYDKLLHMGFSDEMEEIFEIFESNPQLILTSATTIDKSTTFIRSSTFKTIDFREDEDSKLKIYSVRSRSNEKLESLINLLKHFNQEPTLVFCNHRESVDSISTFISKEKIAHGIFYGALEQIDREKNLIKFRGGANNILIATDLAARGLDIPLIKHVVHFELSPNNNEFTHRNGRTARMHAEGQAYIVVSENEHVPHYIKHEVEEFKLKNETLSLAPPKYSCIYFSLGKKDKIRKADILGFLTQACGLEGSDIGLISILDKSSYVAIDSSKVNGLMKGIDRARIKKMRVKVEIAN